MYILGAGSAYPTTIIDRDTLISLVGEPRAEDCDLLDRVGARSIRTTLDIDYIRRTGNTDLLEAWKNSHFSPTDLGVIAVERALATAGITMEQVGLVVGTTSTPYQTCPSEAQRVAGRFGFKIPSYDIVGGMAAVPLYIETLMSWKADRLPQYIVCVFTDTPTQHVDYSQAAPEPFIFGDAASAMVLSSTVNGRLKVVSSHLRKNVQQGPAIEISRRASVKAETLLPASEMQSMASNFFSKMIEGRNVDKAALFFVGPELFAAESAQCAESIGVPKENVLSSTLSRGYSMGSAPLCALADRWSSISTGQHVAIIHGGDGVWSSSLLCACE